MYAKPTLAVFALVLLTVPMPVRGNELLHGHELYRSHCAACHGIDATGDGPMAPALRVPPADLTTIQMRNGGRWPFTRVWDVIDGRRDVMAHGPRDMPVWGRRFSEQAGGGAAGEIEVRKEISALMDYLRSLQRGVSPVAPEGDAP